MTLKLLNASKSVKLVPSGRKHNVPFYDLKNDSVRRVKTAIREMEICSRALDVGLLVDLPVLKGHGQTKMTCALKNLKGCLPDKEKRRFHAEGLMKPKLFYSYLDTYFFINIFLRILLHVVFNALVQALIIISFLPINTPIASLKPSILYEQGLCNMLKDK